MVASERGPLVAVGMCRADPKALEWVSRCPEGCNAGPNGCKFGAGDGLICGAQICEHGGNRDIGKAEHVIIKSGNVQSTNDSKNLFLHLFMEGGGKNEFNKGRFEDADGFVNLKLGGICRKHRSVTGMQRELKAAPTTIRYLAAGMTSPRWPWAPPPYVEDVA